MMLSRLKSDFSSDGSEAIKREGQYCTMGKTDVHCNIIYVTVLCVAKMKEPI